MTSGVTLSEKLSVGGVSLWEVVSPFLTLYRFPEFILKADPDRFAQTQIKETLRLYRGMLSQARNNFFYVSRRSLTDCVSWSKISPRVLFINFWPLFYRETFRPAAEYLADNNSIATAVLFVDEKFPEKPSRSLIQFHVSYRHAGPSVINRVKEYQKYLKQIENEFLRELREVTRPDLPDAWPNLKREFRWLFLVLFPRLAREIAVAKHIIDEHSPGIIISPDDSDWARIYTILARAAGIPSLIIQQGLLDEKAVEWSFFTADRIASIGPSSRVGLCSHGIDEKKIELTGCPRFDVLCRSSAEERDNIRLSIGIKRGQKMVLLASQRCVYGAFSSFAARTEMLRAMAKVAESFESVHLVVKSHPTEDVSVLRRLIGNGKRLSFVESSADIQDLIIACDVFVTFASTSALQALIARKPVISLCFQGSGVINPYNNSEAIFTARSENELMEYLKILTGSERDFALAAREDAKKKLIYDLTYFSDGLASHRVAELILKTIEVPG